MTLFKSGSSGDGSDPFGNCTVHLPPLFRVGNIFLNSFYFRLFTF